ncbi:Peptidase M19, renal dipeptidase [Metarhizium brunneum]
MDKMGSPEHSSLEQALELMSRVPLIDGHNDWMHMIRAYYDFQVDERFEPQRDLAGHVDLKRLVEGRAGANDHVSDNGFSPKEEDDFSDALHLYSLRDTVQQIDLLYRIVDLYPDNLEIVHKSQDIMRIFKSGKCASLMGAEGLHQIGNSSSALRIFHRLGVRYVTLAHGKNNLYVDSATSKAPVHHGLSSHGRDMVREMNRIGMIVDLSHVSEAAMVDALNVSQAPVIFSHSSAYALVPHARNVPDHVLDLLKENGGIIMISFIPWLTNNEPEKSTVDDVVDHIVYVGDRIGYHHLGLGSDFDGMPTHVQGLEDVSKYPNVVARMLERGISPEDVEKVIGLNLIRVLRDVEEFAASHCRSISVLEDKVPQLWDDGIRTHVKGLYPNAEHDKPHGNVG